MHVYICNEYNKIYTLCSALVNVFLFFILFFYSYEKKKTSTLTLLSCIYLRTVDFSIFTFHYETREKKNMLYVCCWNI